MLQFEVANQYVLSSHPPQRIYLIIVLVIVVKISPHFTELSLKRGISEQYSPIHLGVLVFRQGYSSRMHLFGSSDILPRGTSILDFCLKQLNCSLKFRKISNGVALTRSSYSIIFDSKHLSNLSQLVLHLTNLSH